MWALGAVAVDQGNCLREPPPVLGRNTNVEEDPPPNEDPQRGINELPWPPDSSSSESVKSS
jgi:hypothetical protein